LKSLQYLRRATRINKQSFIDTPHSPCDARRPQADDALAPPSPRPATREAPGGKNGQRRRRWYPAHVCRLLEFWVGPRILALPKFPTSAVSGYLDFRLPAGVLPA